MNSPKKSDAMPDPLRLSKRDPLTEIERQRERQASLTPAASDLGQRGPMWQPRGAGLRTKHA
jgi:hypothetical protein